MLYAQYVRLTEDVAYPLKPPLFSSNKVTSRKSKKLWTKGFEWNNAAYEKKKTLTTLHTQLRIPPIPTPFNQRERMGKW